MSGMETIERLESAVRGYVRSFPTVFHKAEGVRLENVNGDSYLDFFGGAGALNYGHNNPVLRDALLEYIQSGAITHSLDMASTEKIAFLEDLDRILLAPRGLKYRVQFPGPTGTNAVEAAIKLARKATGREGVVAFTNGYHGMTLGALAVTGNSSKRAGAGLPLAHTTFMPFADYLGDEANTLGYFETFLHDSSSGMDKPAAVILETVQAEGGVNVASFDWLRRLRKLTADNGILLIVDDIQVGCGRTGPFFSFEPADIQPDIITLSKSLSGYGLPFAVVLMRPELDVWQPGEHNGTFRGFNLAMATARAALRFWEGESRLTEDVERRHTFAMKRLQEIVDRFGDDMKAEVRGRGMIMGIACEDVTLPARFSQEAFRRRLLIETAGPSDNVLKLLPPIVIPDDELATGLDRIEAAVETVLLEQRAS